MIDAVWSAQSPARCGQGGACWAFVAAKIRFILFGVYPVDEQWRPLAVVGLVVAMVLLSLPPRHWGRRLLAAWGVAVAAMLALMWGGFGGMSYVSTASWDERTRSFLRQILH